MSADLLVLSRAALLDALVALAEQRKAVVVIGAQAIYPRTPAAPVALAESTKDCDLALDPRVLSNSPLIDEAMTAAGFVLNPKSNQPGAWQTPTGIPVDLMFPSCWSVREAAEHEALACLRTTRGRCDGRWVSRLNDKDAHDLCRILRGKPTDVFTRGVTVVLEDRVSQEVSHIAVDGLKEHVASGPPPHLPTSHSGPHASRGLGVGGFVAVDPEAL